MKLQGNVALVTGSGRGIGKATSIKYAENGADLILADIDVELVEKTAIEIRKIGRKCVTVNLDVGDIESIDNMIDVANREMGGIGLCERRDGV